MQKVPFKLLKMSSTTKHQGLTAYAALLAVAFIYGANYLIAKGLMPDLIQASGFIVLRVMGALALFGLLYMFKYEAIEKRDLVRFFFCGLTGVALNQLFFFNGLSLTSPLNASIIMTSNPILVMVMSAIILKTKITSRKIAGIVLGAGGAISLLLLSASTSSVFASAKGDLMILINAASYGVYLVIVKPLMQRYKPTTVIFYTFLMGALVVLPVGAKQALDIDWSLFSSADYSALFYVILGTTFLAYLLNVFALKRVQPTVVSVYIYLQPLMAGVCALLFAYWGLTDYTGDFSWKTLVCAILIFIGVYLVSFTPKKTE